jgi:hypothetical protein
MFQLHDRTRRRLTILAFCCLCALPTILVIGWGLWRRLPGHMDAEARRLSHQLGVKVTLEGIEHLRPGTVRYQGLTLVDSETGTTLVKCRRLEAGWRTSFNPNGEGELALVLTGWWPEVHIGRLNQLWRVIENVLVRQSQFAKMRVQLDARQAALLLEDSSEGLDRVRGLVQTTAERAQAELSFEMPGLEMAEPAQIRILRDRSVTPPTTALELSTGATPLPCSLLAFGIPGFRPLGSKSTFGGRLWARKTSGGWDGGLAGQFAALDLAEALGGRFPHHLGGELQVTVDSLRVHDGRVSELAGSASGGSGQISRSLVQSAVRYLGLADGPVRGTPTSLLPYGELAMRFLLDHRGLELHGQCSSPSSGVLLADQYGPLLGDPPPGPIPVVNLVQTLVPPDRPQVSATQQTEWFMRWLPIPERATDVKEIASARLEPVR